MANYDLISLIIFSAILLIFYLRNKEKFTIQGKIIALYRTKLGLNWMDKIAKFSPKWSKRIGYFGVFIGFAGMLFIFVFLIKETLKFVTTPGAPPPLAPVLPGVSIPGIPTLSFWHWIIAIFIVAVVHEFSHGILARVHDIKIKSSGFAFLGPILAAFVEPDEKQLARKSTMKKLSVFAAGPFSNLIIGGVFFLLFLLVASPVSNMFEAGGVMVGEFLPEFPAERIGLEVPFTVYKVNGEETMDFLQFVNETSKIKPDDEVVLVTDQGEFSMMAAANPNNESRGFMGITDFRQNSRIKDAFAKYSILANIAKWFIVLLSWLFIINLGVGLFNLLPLGIVDGGRMFLVAVQKIFKNQKRAYQLFGIVTWTCLLLIFINLLPWLIKLFTWIVNGFKMLSGLF